MKMKMRRILGTRGISGTDVSRSTNVDTNLRWKRPEGHNQALWFLKAGEILVASCREYLPHCRIIALIGMAKHHNHRR